MTTATTDSPADHPATPEGDAERLIELIIAVSVGADSMGTLADELDALAASVNALTGVDADRNARHVESLAVTLGIALYEQVRSLDAVNAVIRDHWSKD